MSAMSSAFNRLRQSVAKSRPRSLYVSRKVVNAEDLIAWARGQGFRTTLPAEDLHVTVAYSRTPVDWMAIGADWSEANGEITINPGGPREVLALGPGGAAKALAFSSWALSGRHRAIIEAGASWDWPDYQPHVTISYDDEAPDLMEVEPYRGAIVLGPEIFEEVKEGWRDRVIEKRSVALPPEGLTTDQVVRAQKMRLFAAVGLNDALARVPVAETEIILKAYRARLQLQEIQARYFDKAIHRHPAGAAGGRGGQFAPSGQGGGPSGPARPNTSRFNQDHPTVRRVIQRMDQIDAAVARGDLDFVRSMSTSRTHSYHIALDDYRQAVLAHHEPQAQLARLRGTRPQPPDMTARNEGNTALVSANRHILRLTNLAETADDPLAALQNYQMGSGAARTNTYLTRAMGYRTALIAHFQSGEGASTAAAPAPVPPPPSPAPRTPQRAPRPPPVAAPAPEPAPEPTPAPAPVARITLRTGSNGEVTAPGARFRGSNIQNTTVTVDGIKTSLDDIAVSTLAANPKGVRASTLGFVPRPDVDIRGTVTRQGFQSGTRLTPWATPEQAELARAYLDQPTSLQIRAREYQVGSWVPDTPEVRAQRIEAERVASERVRAAAIEAMSRRAAIPEIYRTQSPIGANIIDASVSVSASRFEAPALQSETAARTFFSALVADYGAGETFRVAANVSGKTASVRYSGSGGTSMTREFTQTERGVEVYHAFFRAGSQGNGAGKRFFRASMGEYMAAGVKTVKVTANIDVGGYAWARYGYLPLTQGGWDNLRSTLQSKLSNLQRSGRVSSETYAAASAILNKSNRKALWEIADFAGAEGGVGKSLLMGTTWSGKIDLDDGLQMARFSAYVSDG